MGYSCSTLCRNEKRTQNLIMKLEGKLLWIYCLCMRIKLMGAITTKSLWSYGLDASVSGQDINAAIFTQN
jgi:hypothetical protein